MAEVVVESLTGRLYRSNDKAKGARGALKVVGDDGGDRVWVENEYPPHSRRQILRRRLLSKQAYALVGSSNGASPEAPLVGPPPEFDGQRFAAKLRNWMQSEGLTVDETAERCGVHPSTIHNLRRGVPQSTTRRQTQEKIQPSINSLAAIAHGLNLEVSYVMAWAGLGDTDRWKNFSASERLGIALAIGADTDDASALDAALADLKREL